MTESILLGVAAVFVLGIGAQWLAWRFRLPSILLLLVFGFLAGPVTGLLPQAALQGDWLFPFVSLAVGVILFEGGLTLRFDELREVGRAVFNLITVGVAVTAVLASVGVHYLVGLSWEVAIVMGTLLTVTGPTVVLPLLRHVRPAGRIGTIAKWEGITIDPIGAILAVLVLESVILVRESAADGTGEGIERVLGHLAQGLAMEVVVGIGVSVASAALLILLLRRRLVPGALQNPVALMVVIAAFAVANTLKDEAGLLEATLLGIFMANQRYVSVRRIVEFKEDLRVLLISLLFIVLSARLDIEALDVMLAPGPLLFLAGLMFIVRPLATWLSSLRTGLSWREIAFLAWLAPRGIVAAAVASLFAIKLGRVYEETRTLHLEAGNVAAAARIEPLLQDVSQIVPVVFLVIVGTVAVYGLTIGPLARWLGLAQPNPQGVLFVGAHDWARQIAEAVRESGFRVLLVDSNPRHVREAHRMGLEAERANVLAEGILDELDLSGIGQLVALTPNDEVNSLAALHFGEAFESKEIYQLAARSGSNRPETELPQHLRGRPAFGPQTTYLAISEAFERGARVERIKVEEEGLTLARFRRRYGEEAAPLFLARRPQRLVVLSEDGDFATVPDDVVVALVDLETRAGERSEQGEAPESAPQQNDDGEATAPGPSGERIPDEM